LYYKPLVLLIWFGAVVMVIGGSLSLSDRRLRVGAPKPARSKAALSPAEEGYEAPSRPYPAHPFSPATGGCGPTGRNPFGSCAGNTRPSVVKGTAVHGMSESVDRRLGCAASARPAYARA